MAAASLSQGDLLADNAAHDVVAAFESLRDLMNAPPLGVVAHGVFPHHLLVECFRCPRHLAAQETADTGPGVVAVAAGRTQRRQLSLLRPPGDRRGANTEEIRDLAWLEQMFV